MSEPSLRIGSCKDYYGTEHDSLATEHTINPITAGKIARENVTITAPNTTGPYACVVEVYEQVGEATIRSSFIIEVEANS